MRINTRTQRTHGRNGKTKRTRKRGKTKRKLYYIFICKRKPFTTQCGRAAFDHIRISNNVTETHSQTKTPFPVRHPFVGCDHIRNGNEIEQETNTHKQDEHSRPAATPNTESREGRLTTKAGQFIAMLTP